MEKEQYCFNCGESLGIYRAYPGELQTCGKMECEREARNQERAEDEEMRERAATDHFNRYRS